MDSTGNGSRMVVPFMCMPMLAVVVPLRVVMRMRRNDLPIGFHHPAVRQVRVVVVVLVDGERRRRARPEQVRDIPDCAPPTPACPGSRHDR
ncbi:MAG: hypothetical protein V9G20_30060 [Candidatus Promineifilaceae bacterium]